MRELALGDYVRDVVTGLQGTITGICCYLNAEPRAQVAPVVKQDGSYAGPEWFDIGRLVITSIDG